MTEQEQFEQELETITNSMQDPSFPDSAVLAILIAICNRWGWNVCLPENEGEELTGIVMGDDAYIEKLIGPTEDVEVEVDDEADVH